MEEIGKFLFVAAAVVALFTFLTASHWVTTRADERRARERYAVLRKVAEQPTEAAQQVLGVLREEDARAEEHRRRKASRARRDSLQGGAILVATGVGLGIFLYAVAPTKAVWTLGIMLVLMGIVVTAFAFFSKEE